MLLELRPGLLTAWRGPGRLQLGTGRRGVVLDGLDPAEERLLAALDGSLDARGLEALAAQEGLPVARARHLLHVLGRAGALVPRRTPRHRLLELPAPLRRRSAPDARVLCLAHPDGDGWHVLARRRRATAVVAGASRTGLGVARGLALAGVGTVLVEDDSAVTAADVGGGGFEDDDVGRPRGQRAAALVAACAPGVRTAPEPGAGSLRPDVVVLVAGGALDARRTEALVREGVPHLPVLWREDTTSVGPLVRPGASACARCVELHRTDRDPQWPRLVAQLATAAPGGPARPEESSLAALTAALATVQALAQVDGVADPAALDATLEASLPEGAVLVRPWSAHPRCGCTWPGDGPPPGPG
ncbi:hypothetical protein [Quadrisphaera sp. DSM 44207]|uniref:hypothetical protein n=1 Tax=Quadrisphaera sp. DSM 44207 TaxID=1881057 RepID=UPI000884B70B|nr:hypothetical protein [Quadrisphaera sp. DSM 44207]SDQ08243.1 ThiF family protein [Quadrisphaera sp. DSM 44207]